MHKSERVKIIDNKNRNEKNQKEEIMQIKKLKRVMKKIWYKNKKDCINNEW